MKSSQVRSIAINMFNKSIQEEFSGRLRDQRKLPEPTGQVEAVCKVIRQRKRNVVVSALAGSGKTTLIEQSIRNFAASTRAQTCHSAGNSAYARWLEARYGKKAQLDEYKVSNILKKLHNVEILYADCPEKGEFILGSARELVSTFKSQGFVAIRPAASNNECYEIACKYDINLEGEKEWNIDPIAIFDLARAALEESNAQVDIIDFDDMIYLPVLYDCSFFKNDLIYIDESQDLNPIRIAMIEKAAGDWSQVVFVGDRNQSIYGFTGADVEAMDSIIKKFDCVELPLSVCWRCSKAVIREAQKIVPDIEHAPDAPEGSVSMSSHDNMIRSIKAKDFVLCRTTAPVVEVCLQLIRNGKAATVRGRDIGKGLTSLAKKISKRRVSKKDGPVSVIQKLSIYREEQEVRLSAKENQKQSMLDKIDTLLVLAEDCESFDELKRRIESIFSEEKGDSGKLIICSTIHKSKGLEAENVYVVRPDLLPGPWATQEWQKEQEKNLKYVAITRAKLNLIWVNNRPKS